MIVPLIDMKPHGYFRDDQKSKEPNTWRKGLEAQYRVQKENPLKVVEFNRNYSRTRLLI